jgi:hypothetical protein
MSRLPRSTGPWPGSSFGRRARRAVPLLGAWRAYWPHRFAGPGSRRAPRVDRQAGQSARARVGHRGRRRTSARPPPAGASCCVRDGIDSRAGRVPSANPRDARRPRTERARTAGNCGAVPPVSNGWHGHAGRRRTPLGHQRRDARASPRPPTRCAVAARGAAVAASGADGDARAGTGAGPLSRWAAAVRVSAGGCRSASEPDARAVGTAAAAVGAGPGDWAERAVDVRAAVGRTQHRRHRARADRARRAVPVRGRSAAEPAPRRWTVEDADRRRDLEQPALHGQAGVGQAAADRATLRQSMSPVDVGGGSGRSR